MLESGALKALYEELELVVRTIERIDEKLAGLNRPPLPEVTLQQVREFVNSQIEDLEKLLFGSAEALKMDFQRRITQIVVTPVQDETGRFFRITGDVDLFVAPEGVVRTNQVDLIGLHYTIPIAVEIAPYLRVQKTALRQLPEIGPKNRTGSRLTSSSAQCEQNRIDVPDTVFETAQRIDTGVLLQMVYEERNSSAFARSEETWKGEICESSLDGPGVFRDGFGGLRLVSSEPEDLNSEGLAEKVEKRTTLRAEWTSDLNRLAMSG